MGSRHRATDRAGVRGAGRRARGWGDIPPAECPPRRPSPPTAAAPRGPRPPGSCRPPGRVTLTAPGAAAGSGQREGGRRGQSAGRHAHEVHGERAIEAVVPERGVPPDQVQLRARAHVHTAHWPRPTHGSQVGAFTARYARQASGDRWRPRASGRDREKTPASSPGCSPPLPPKGAREVAPGPGPACCEGVGDARLSSSGRRTREREQSAPSGLAGRHGGGGHLPVAGRIMASLHWRQETARDPRSIAHAQLNARRSGRAGTLGWAGRFPKQDCRRRMAQRKFRGKKERCAAFELNSPGRRQGARRRGRRRRQRTSGGLTATAAIWRQNGRQGGSMGVQRAQVGRPRERAGVPASGPRRRVVSHRARPPRRSSPGMCACAGTSRAR
jgi:hypothetical protein